MGFWEVLLILIIAFLVVGPKKVPEIARTMGKGARWLKKSYTDFKVALAKDFDVTEDSTNNSMWNKKKIKHRRAFARAA
jgi:Sec-independent protein secretion pathway components